MNRTVHARCTNHAPDGSGGEVTEIVRYDLAGKWYLESPTGKQSVTVTQAARYAAMSDELEWEGGQPGGLAFDRKLRLAWAMSEMASRLKFTREPIEAVPAFGNPNTAQLEIQVFVDSEGERDVDVRCLCAACMEISNAGINLDDYPDNGVYYMEAWHETWSNQDGTHHDGGLRLSE